MPYLCRGYRENLIELVEHWIDNIARDAGIVAPYIFVILSILSTALFELEWSCVNSVRTKRQLFGSSEHVCEMATRDDDTFPVLLKSVLELRRLLLQYAPLIEQHLVGIRDLLKQELTVLPQLAKAEKIEKDDWIRVQFRLKDQALQTQRRAMYLCHLLTACSDVPRWLTDRSEIRCMGSLYNLLRSFCEKFYYRTNQDFSYIFLFIDLADMVEHSHFSPPNSTYYQDAYNTIQDLVERIVEIQEVLWNNGHSWEGVDREELEQYAFLLTRYHRIELKEDVIV